MKFPVKEQKVRSSRTGKSTGYTIEARHNTREVLKYGRQLFDNRWREIDIFEVPPSAGIPSPRHREELKIAGLYSYEQAQALRWQFIAAVDALEGISGWCLETRLVAHDLSLTYEAKTVEYIDPQTRRGAIPDDMQSDD